MDQATPDSWLARGAEDASLQPRGTDGSLPGISFLSVTATVLLLLCCTSLNIVHNDKPKTAVIYDLALAAGNLRLEATARGLCVHQMIGILSDRDREAFMISERVQAVTAMAIGYTPNPDNLPENLKARELAPRQRKPLTDIVFAGK